MNDFKDKANFIWAVANLLRGPYRPNQYKDVMLPMTVLRRLDCVLIEKDFREAVGQHLLRQVYDQIRAQGKSAAQSQGDEI